MVRNFSKSDFMFCFFFLFVFFCDFRSILLIQYVKMKKRQQTNKQTNKKPCTVIHEVVLKIMPPNKAG